VRNRTVASAGFVVVPFLIVLWSVATLANDIADRRYTHAAFAGVNAVLTLYAMLVLHGIRNTVADVAQDLRDRLYRPVAAPAQAPAAPDWVTVLYHGSSAPGEARGTAAVAEALAAADQERSARAGDSAPGPLPPLAPAPPIPTGTAREAARTLADALGDALAGMGAGGTFVVRMNDDGMEVAMGGRRSDGGGRFGRRAGDAA
jgi:hypothetical protein